MDHSHSQTDRPHDDDGLKTAFFLNLAFTLIEIAGGLWTNSIAVLTDALHDAGDCASLGAAWYFNQLSNRGRTSTHTYGYRRHRLLGAMITGVTLTAGIGFVLWHAVSRLLAPEPVNAPGVIVLAVAGIAFNGIAVLRVRKGASLTEKMVGWHLLEDTLGWVVVLIGALVMTFWNVPVVDPILSLLVSAFILVNVARNLKQVIAVFLQTSPNAFDPEEFEQNVGQLLKVRSVHHLHSWSLDGEKHVLTAHLVMAKDSTRSEIVEAKCRVGDLAAQSDFVHITVDVELEDEPCAMECQKSSEETGEEKQHV